MGLDEALRNEIRKRVKGRLLFDEPMSGRTFLRVGGPADAYVQPAGVEELSLLAEWLQREDVCFVIVGGGTNLLVTDAGIRGVVIDMSSVSGDSSEAAGKGFCVSRPEKSGSREDICLVRAMAGCSLAGLCRFSIEEGLGGLVFAVGIPGTVGGAIAVNAGAAGESMGDVLSWARILNPDGSVGTVQAADISFSYRSTVLPGPESPRHPRVIVEGCFKLYREDSRRLARKAQELRDARFASQPYGEAGAGCFFKNPENAEPAGRLIEEAGMKGVKVGGAQVSEKHANFFLNIGGASAGDFFRLMEKVKNEVYRKFHVELEPEVRIVGD